MSSETFRRIRDLTTRAIEDECTLAEAIALLEEARENLASLGVLAEAAGTLLCAAGIAQRHGANVLARTLCQRAAADAPWWGEVYSTMAHVETTLALEYLSAHDIARASLMLGRGARHHRKAARLMLNAEPHEAAIENRLADRALAKRQDLRRGVSRVFRRE